MTQVHFFLNLFVYMQLVFRIVFVTWFVHSRQYCTFSSNTISGKSRKRFGKYFQFISILFWKKNNTKKRMNLQTNMFLNKIYPVYWHVLWIFQTEE